MTRTKNSTGYDLDIEFNFMGKSYIEQIDIPFDIFIEAFRQYSDFKDVIIDGRDSKIWNLLIDLEALDTVASNIEFKKLCKELYMASKYYDEDHDKWTEDMQDDYDFENNLGKYKK